MPSESEQAVALLRYANYAKVAEALLVSRASVADWAKGRSVTPYRLRQLEQLLRPDLQTAENSPPAWAEGLRLEVLAAIQAAVLVNDPSLEAAFEERYAELLGALRPPPSAPGSDRGLVHDDAQDTPPRRLRP